MRLAKPWESNLQAVICQDLLRILQSLPKRVHDTNLYQDFQMVSKNLHSRSVELRVLQNDNRETLIIQKLISCSGKYVEHIQTLLLEDNERGRIIGRRAHSISFKGKPSSRREVPTAGPTILY